MTLAFPRAWYIVFWLVFLIVTRVYLVQPILRELRAIRIASACPTTP